MSRIKLIEDVRKQITKLEKKKVKLTENIDIEIATLFTTIKQIRESCGHENKDVYKDYYSKITTCLDCGEVW